MLKKQQADNQAREARQPVGLVALTLEGRVLILWICSLRFGHFLSC